MPLTRCVPAEASKNRNSSAVPAAKPSGSGVYGSSAQTESAIASPVHVAAPTHAPLAKTATASPASSDPAAEASAGLDGTITVAEAPDGPGHPENAVVAAGTDTGAIAGAIAGATNASASSGAARSASTGPANGAKKAALVDASTEAPGTRGNGAGPVGA